MGFLLSHIQIWVSDYLVLSYCDMTFMVLGAGGGGGESENLQLVIAAAVG